MREDENQICVLTWHGVLDPSRKAMPEEELSNLNWGDVARRLYDNPQIWRDARRYGVACTTLARQAAFKAAGPRAPQYFAKNRNRLLAEAAELIARSPNFERWRFPR
jgi:hypothetical protein